MASDIACHVQYSTYNPFEVELTMGIIAGALTLLGVVNFCGYVEGAFDLGG